MIKPVLINISTISFTEQAVLSPAKCQFSLQPWLRHNSNLAPYAPVFYCADISILFWNPYKKIIFFPCNLHNHYTIAHIVKKIQYLPTITWKSRVPLHFNAHITTTVNAPVNANNSAVTAQGFQNQLTATLLLSPQTKRPLLQHNCSIIFLLLSYQSFQTTLAAAAIIRPCILPLVRLLFLTLSTKSHQNNISLKADAPISPFIYSLKANVSFIETALCRRKKALYVQIPRISPQFLSFMYSLTRTLLHKPHSDPHSRLQNLKF